MSAECPANAFTGVHIPRDGGVTCGRCGEQIPGLVARAEGMEHAISAAYATEPEYVAAFRAVAALLAARGVKFTSEDVTDKVGFYREPGTNRNNAVGALMAAMAKAGLIRRVGETYSRNERQHGARIAVWVGNNSKSVA